MWAENPISRPKIVKSVIFTIFGLSETPGTFFRSQNPSEHDFSAEIVFSGHFQRFPARLPSWLDTLEVGREPHLEAENREKRHFHDFRALRNPRYVFSVAEPVGTRFFGRNRVFGAFSAFFSQVTILAGHPRGGPRTPSRG